MKRLALIFLIVVLVALFAFGAMLATQPRLHTTYTPDQFATASDIDSQRGFYSGETDAAGNHYVWTQERATLVFDFLVHTPVTFTFTMRSAAVAGGPDQPVQVTVNGREAGELHPDPANPAFQAISLRLVPYDWGGQRTGVKLLPATFKPKGDSRTLGTMIQSISVDKGEAWSPISRRIWLLWALPVLALLALACRWVPRRYRSSWTAYGAVALFLAGMGCAAAILVLVLRIGAIEQDTARVWVLGSACIGLCFAVGAASAPIELLGGRSPFQRARDRIASSRRVPRARGMTQPAAVVPRSNTGGRDRREIGSLTGLRSIAVLLVYFSHLGYSERQIPEVVRTFLFSGFDGVSIFFVLSGFVICYNYYDRMAENPRAHLWEFFVARFARLYPMYLLAFLWVFSSQNINRQLHTSRFIILPNLTMTQAWSTKASVYFGYNPVSWSLSVEAFFYVIFPFLAFVLLRRLSRIWQLIMVGIVTSCTLLAAAMWFSVTKNLDFYGSPHYWLYQLPATRTGDFVLGCLAARIFVLRSAVPITQREAKIGGGALLFCMFAIGVIMCINVPALIPFRFGPAYAPFIVIAIYCLARYNTISSRVLSTKPLLLLGAASYSFYLIHVILLGTLSIPASTIGAQTAYLHDLLIFAVVTILSIGAYLYVEMPTRKFLRRVLTRQRSPVLQQSIVEVPGVPGIVDGWQPGRRVGGEAVGEALHDGEPIPVAESIQVDGSK